MSLDMANVWSNKNARPHYRNKEKKDLALLCLSAVLRTFRKSLLTRALYVEAYYD